MKNRIYPCILKGSYDWLAYDKNNAIALHGVYDKNKGFIDFDRDGFTNITAEYLKNTYGKVESPEHAEFIIELCKGNGIKTYKYHSQIAEYFMINKNKLSFVTAADCAIRNDLGYPRKKQVTIPMPPKTTKQGVSVNDFNETAKKASLTLDGDKGWPQVGDEVMFPTDRGVIAIEKPDDQGIVIVKCNDDELGLIYKRVSIEALSKPKTEDEILRDKIGSILDSYVMSDKVKSHFVDEIINITKKLQ